VTDPGEHASSSAEPLERLLAVQALDTRTDQLRHRRQHLSERAELASRQAELSALAATVAEVEGRRHALVREQSRLEDEVAALEGRAIAADKTLYSGTVRAPRELQALQADIESIRRRQHDLEDRELDLMEQIEPLDKELAVHAASRAGLEAARADLTARIAAAEADIDTELTTVVADRAAAAAALPAELSAEYERLRSRLGGIGAARLTGNRCEGCHLTLSAMEVDAIRHQPPGAPVHCSECGRLLVR
jgi:uncharacterized protein